MKSEKNRVLASNFGEGEFVIGRRKNLILIRADNILMGALICSAAAKHTDRAPRTPDALIATRRSTETAR